jgi:hypothetical protein
MREPTTAPGAVVGAAKRRAFWAPAILLLVTSLLAISGASSGVSAASKVKPNTKVAFAVKVTKRSVVLVGGRSTSVRVSVTQSRGMVMLMSYSVSSRLTQVGLTMSEESADGVTVVLEPGPDAKKQRGFVDVLAKGGSKTKKVRINVSVVPGTGLATDAGPVTVAAGATPVTTPGVTAPNPPTPVVPASTTVGTTQPVGDFSVSVNAASVKLSAGKTQTIEVALTPTGGYTGTPTMSLINQPAGLFSDFATPTSKTGSTVVLGVQTSTIRGDYPVTIQATDRRLTRTANFVVEVRKFGPVTINVTNMPSFVSPLHSPVARVQFAPVNSGDDLPPLTLVISPGTAYATSYVIPDGTTSIDPLVKFLGEGDFAVPFILQSRIDGSEVVRKTLIVKVTSFFDMKFTGDGTVVAVASAPATTVTDNSKSVGFSMREIAGAPVTFSCTNTTVGLLAAVSGGSGEYRINFSIQLLSFGTYTVRCTATSGTFNQVLTATVVTRPA